MARILVIEDNQTNLELMVYLLKAFGHEPDGRHDGVAGLEAVRRDPPDLVLCDIQLPKMNGYDVVRELRSEERFRNLPLVAVTALAMRGDRERVMAAGFDGYIEKPIVPETFVEQVEGLLPPLMRIALAAPVRETTPAPEATPLSHHNGTVLVVDDRPSNLELMQTVLEHGGYRVLLARRMAEALAMMRDHSVHLVVSDVHMPEGGGFELCRAAASVPALKGIPFVFISSTTIDDLDRDAAAELGVRTLIERPVEPSALLKTIARCMPQERSAKKEPAG